MIRKKIQFYGRVQGVGFRFHAQYAAETLGLTGWVKNENDGSVHMEVQGAEELIDRMLLTFKEDRYIRISGMEVKMLPLQEEERNFVIL